MDAAPGVTTFFSNGFGARASKNESIFESTGVLASRAWTSSITSTCTKVKVIKVLLTKRQSKFGYQTCSLYKRLYKMKFTLRHELNTTSIVRSETRPPPWITLQPFKRDPWYFIYRTKSVQINRAAYNQY